MDHSAPSRSRWGNSVAEPTLRQPESSVVTARVAPDTRATERRRAGLGLPDNCVLMPCLVKPEARSIGVPALITVIKRDSGYRDRTS